MKLPFYLETLIASVSHNDSARYNCPLCHGTNTLGITKENGKVKWHCFKASCNLKSGNSKYSRNISELKTSLEPRTAVKPDFKIPDYLIYGLGSKKTLQMLTKGNCLDVYRQGLFDVAYDPVQDRVCFVIKKDNKIVGLIGKSCHKSAIPKVLNYGGGDNTTPFICGYTDTLVLVEDGLSAASVARIPQLSGLALLGSSLKVEYIPTIRTYKRVIVALDRDARKKALAIKRKLCYYHSNVSIWLLETDIKDQDDTTLKSNYERIIK